MLGTMLAGMDDDVLPVAVGVIYCDPAKSYDEGVKEVKAEAVKRAGGEDLKAMMHAGHTWTVSE